MPHTLLSDDRYSGALLCALTIVLGLAQAARGQPNSRDKPSSAAKEPVVQPRVYQCRWADSKIVIDGKADDKAWQHAEVIDKFALPWLRTDKRPPRTATKARLLWDRENLYFFAEMEDHDLYADITEHDGRTWDNDVFELFFKPGDDKPGYYEFQVNAAGTVMDMFIPRRNSGGYARYIRDGDFHIEAKVARNGTLNKWQDKDVGWSVEGCIPWRDFLRTGGRPTVDERWKFALCRYDYSVEFEGPELSTCAPLASLPYPDFHHFEDYAVLRFVGPSEKTSARPHGIDRFTAVTTSRVVGSPEPPPPFRAVRALPKLRLSFPIFLINEPGSRRLIFIDQRSSYGPARICRTSDDPDSGKYETLMEVDGVAYSIAFHPKFAENGYMFVGSNGPLTGTKKCKITRYTLGRQSPYALDPKSAKLIIEWESDGHNGAAMAFGHDGMLYITSGDGTSDSDTNVTGQGLDHLLAKVLRIDVDHPDPGRPYSVPKDNPFVGKPGVRPETWAYGFRNPWRMTADPKTGQLWVGNNGQDLWEQIFLVERGANYGWSVYEGSHIFYPNRKLGPTPHTKPTFEHPHSEARSLTGGVVYYGKQFPELQGAYLYGDYSTGKIWAGKHDRKKVTFHQEIADTTLAISAFALDAEGELLIVDHRGSDEGGFYRLERNPAPAGGPAAFPHKLSESGLFASVKGHKVQPGLIPYSVNAPLWSDGAYKERYLALPGKEPKIDFTTWRAWGFPDQTVIVKSFALDMEEGNAASRRWIETRFLTKQEGEWVGYSYIWNDEQTDAMLVAKEGIDRKFTIRTPRGPREQTWRYPSRTECMVCHSRAANFVLGLTTLQMNKDHDYGSAVDNQLRVLEHLGVFKVNWHGETTSLMRKELDAAGMAEKQVNERMEAFTATRGQREATPAGALLDRPPEKHDKLVDPYDAKQDLNLRARSYLHANCSQCHVDAGGGNAQIDLEFTTKAEKMKLIDVKPLHHTFGLTDPRLVAPGAPERSVLLHRVAHRGQGQMPQLATALVDEAAVRMLREWIASLRPSNTSPKR
jgi:glucose/arabinose dehydrogenase